MWQIFGRYRGRRVVPTARQMNLIAAILNHVTQGTGIRMTMPQSPSTDAPWIISVDVEWLMSFIASFTSGNFVTLNTAQDITGAKNFVGANVSVKYANNTRRTDIRSGSMTLLASDPYPNPYIDFNYGGSESFTSRLIAYQNNELRAVTGRFAVFKSGETDYASIENDKIRLGNTSGVTSTTIDHTRILINHSDGSARVQLYGLSYGGGLSLESSAGTIASIMAYDLSSQGLGRFTNFSSSDGLSITAKNVNIGRNPVQGGLATLSFHPDATTDKLVDTDAAKQIATVGYVNEKAGGAPESPSSYTDLTTSGEGSAAAKSDSWTYDATNGVKVTVQTRTYYDHTASTPVLYGYYRTFTYDKQGRLYSVSAETRYVIDQPVVANLTATA